MAMNRKINQRISKLVAEVCGYLHKPNEGMDRREELIAIVAALGGVMTAVGTNLQANERRYAIELSKHVANQMRGPTKTSPIVGPQGQALASALNR